MSEYIFDDDVFDYWVLQRRLPPRDPHDQIHSRPSHRGGCAPIVAEQVDPYLLIPREDGRNFFGHLVGSTHPCGTEARYNYHRKHGEHIDAACRTAGTAASRQRKIDKKAKDAQVR